MRSSRSLRGRKRIFNDTAVKETDFKQKFKQYRPVKFQSSEAETERKMYGPSPLQKSNANLTCINYHKTQSKQVLQPSNGRVDRSHLIRQSEEIKDFLHRIKTEESPMRSSVVLNSPTSKHSGWGQSTKRLLIANPEDCQSPKAIRRYDDVIDEKNRPLLKSILKEIVQELVVEQKENTTQPRKQNAQSYTLGSKPNAERSKPSLANPASPSCLVIIRDIREQINDMFGSLNMH